MNNFRADFDAAIFGRILVMLLAIVMSFRSPIDPGRQFSVGEILVTSTILGGTVPTRVFRE
jgi:hypothetical protein